MDSQDKWNTKLTRTALVGIVEDTADLIKKVLSSAKSQILHKENYIVWIYVPLLWAESKMVRFNSSCIMKIFSDDNESLKPFNTLLTFQQQVKYYREHFNFVISL